MATEFTSHVGADESRLRALAAAAVVPETRRRHPSGFEPTKEAECEIVAKAWLGVEDFGTSRAVWFALQGLVAFSLFASPRGGIFLLLTHSGTTSDKGKIHHCRDIHNPSLYF